MASLNIFGNGNSGASQPQRGYETCNVDIAPKIDKCDEGIKVWVGEDYDIQKQDDYIIITQTKSTGYKGGNNRGPNKLTKDKFDNGYKGRTSLNNKYGRGRHNRHQSGRPGSPKKNDYSNSDIESDYGVDSDDESRGRRRNRNDKKPDGKSPSPSYSLGEKKGDKIDYAYPSGRKLNKDGPGEAHPPGKKYGDRSRSYSSSRDGYGRDRLPSDGPGGKKGDKFDKPYPGGNVDKNHQDTKYPSGKKHEDHSRSPSQVRGGKKYGDHSRSLSERRGGEGKHRSPSYGPGGKKSDDVEKTYSDGKLDKNNSDTTSPPGPKHGDQYRSPSSTRGHGGEKHDDYSRGTSRGQAGKKDDGYQGAGAPHDENKKDDKTDKYYGPPGEKAGERAGYKKDEYYGISGDKEDEYHDHPNDKSDGKKDEYHGIPGGKKDEYHGHPDDKSDGKKNEYYSPSGGKGEKKDDKYEGTTGVPPKKTPSQCSKPTISANVLDIVKLDVYSDEKIKVFAKIANIDLTSIVGGPLGDTIGKVVTGLGHIVSGLLGGKSKRNDGPNIKKKFDREYDVKCGYKIDRRDGYKTTAKDLDECLNKCLTEAFEKSLGDRSTHDCASVHLSRTEKVNNCWYALDDKTLDYLTELHKDEAYDSLVLKRK